MRILFLSSVFPRPWDKTRGTYCLSLCRALARQTSVIVASPVSWLDRWRQRGARPALAQPHDDAESPLEVTYPTFYYTPGMLHRTHGWCMWQSVRPHLRKMAEQFRPDVVLSYWTYPDGAAAVTFAESLGIPAAIIAGGSDVLLLPRDSRVRAQVVGTLQRATTVLAVSRHLKKAVEQLGLPQEKVHVTVQGIDPCFSPGDQGQARRRLGIQTRSAILLWVGRMAPVKGLEVLLAACQQLRQRQFPFTLVLIGEGPERARCERAVTELGLAKHVVFQGAVANETLPDWYRAADLTVLSSWSEGIPNVLRESLACGTPIVSTNVGGVAEIVSEGRSRLVTAGSAAEFAQAVIETVEQAKPQPAIKFHNWDMAATRHLEIFRSLIDEPLGARQSCERVACLSSL